MDNTYKTNRWGLYLLNIVTLTDHKTTANIAFGVSSSEKEESYHWMLASLDEIRREFQIPAPEVVITDFEKALKNALTTIWPATHQQLRTWHIRPNVKAQFYKKWSKSDDFDDAEDPEPKAFNDSQRAHFSV